MAKRNLTEEKRHIINEQQRTRREIDGDRIRERDRKYRQLNRDKINKRLREYYEKNKTDKEKMEKIRESKRRFEINQKLRALNIIGGYQCSLCDCSDINKLTIDHIDNSGHIDKKNGLRVARAITTNKLSEKQLTNLRVLCWNHNLSRCRKYLDLPYEKQTYGQRYAAKLWKEAFNFFGPCHCGESELKFLTISHIHNDGAERRRKGEKVGIGLIIKFRKASWPESLKKDYCLECANCNCSKIENHPRLSQ